MLPLVPIGTFSAKLELPAMVGTKALNPVTAAKLAGQPAAPNSLAKHQPLAVVAAIAKSAATNSALLPLMVELAAVGLTPTAALL